MALYINAFKHLGNLSTILFFFQKMSLFPFSIQPRDFRRICRPEKHKITSVMYRVRVTPEMPRKRVGPSVCFRQDHFWRDHLDKEVLYTLSNNRLEIKKSQNVVMPQGSSRV